MVCTWISCISKCFNRFSLYHCLVEILLFTVSLHETLFHFRLQKAILMESLMCLQWLGMSCIQLKLIHQESSMSIPRNKKKAMVLVSVYFIFVDVLLVMLERLQNSPMLLLSLLLANWGHLVCSARPTVWLALAPIYDVIFQTKHQKYERRCFSKPIVRPMIWGDGLYSHYQNNDVVIK